MNYLFYLIIISNVLTACTIGITRDNEDNAILWKNRDRWLKMDDIDTKIKSDVEYYPSVNGTLPYICVETRGSNQTFMGMNEAGFGIVNSIVVSDVEEINTRTITNEDELFVNALQTCSTLSDFENIINNLNQDDSEDILSNFAVIDSNGNGAIYEINTSEFFPFSGCNELSSDSGEYYCKQEFSEDMNYLIRTNHFKLTSNPEDNNLNELDDYDCSVDESYSSTSLLSNKIRYCAAENYLESNLNKAKIFETLISTDSNLEEPGLLRSLNKSTFEENGLIKFYLNEDHYPNTYFYQRFYDCAKGEPAGYTHSKYSISRAETLSSIVIKSIKNNSSNSVMFAALGNPLITPYIPFKVLDYDNNILTNVSSLSDSSVIIRQEVFDYDTNADYEDHPYKRWVDTQHLKQYTGSYNAYPANHNGIFNELFELENTFINFEEDILNTEQSIEDIVNQTQNYFSNYIQGFNNNYDDPRYDIGHVEVSMFCQCDFSSYTGRRIYDRTLHRNHNEVNEWKIINPLTNAILTFSDSDYLNPLITASDWTTFDNSIDVSLYINGDLKDTRFFDIGCHISDHRDNIIDNESCENECEGCMESGAYNYDQYADIENESCIYLGDLDNNEIINVVDAVILTNIILEVLDYENYQMEIADINQDNNINIVDVVNLINIILAQ